MVKILSLVILFLVQAGGYAWAGGLSAAEIERVRAFKGIVRDVDAKSFTQTVNELENSPHTLVNLEIKEAMARAYADIVREKKVDGRKDREWLYSKISLNMAYLQFADDQADGGSATPLDVFIRQKLKHYLPGDIFHRTGFHYNLG